MRINLAQHESSAAYRLILRLSHSSPLCHNRCEIDLWLLFHPSKQLLSDASCHNRSMPPFLPVSALLLSTHSIVDGISSHIYNMISEQNRVLVPSLFLFFPLSLSAVRSFTRSPFLVFVASNKPELLMRVLLIHLNGTVRRKRVRDGERETPRES